MHFYASENDICAVDNLAPRSSMQILHIGAFFGCSSRQEFYEIDLTEITSTFWKAQICGNICIFFFFFL